MTASTGQSLKSIEMALLRRGRDPLLAALNPPLGRDYVDSSLHNVGLKPSSSLAAIYSWHDGTKTGISLDDSHLFPGFYFPEFTEALTNYKAFCDSSRWIAGWFPLFADGGGDFYVADFTNAGVPVRRFRIEYAECPIEYNSIEDMLNTLAVAFDDGIFYVDEGGYLEMSDEAYGLLAAKLNPRVTWWNK